LTQAKDFLYRPDFTIFYNDKKFVLEHWGIDEYDRTKSVPAYWSDTWDEYHDTMNRKRNLFRWYNGTQREKGLPGITFMETSVVDLRNGRDVFEKRLKALLEANGIPCIKKDEATLISKIQLNQTSKVIKRIVGFIQAAKKRCEYKKLYDIRNNFYDNITLKNMGFDVIPTKEEIIAKREKEMEGKKPTYADIQEKISNSQWISCSNFIVRFDNDKINIASWRVSGFYYRCDNNLSVTVNDFSEKNEDGSYNILMQIVSKLTNYRCAGNICVDIIDNSGELLYKMVFEGCDFTYADNDGFTYESTALRKVILNFHYKRLHILSPNEKLNETAN
jgi:hypothetical protein